MQVTMNRRGWGRLKRPPLAAVLMLALAGLGGIANAAEFDENLREPMMKSAVETRAQAKSFTVKIREIRAATPAQLITSAALARQQFDLKWQIQRTIDAGKPLDEFAELGLVSRGDGSYSIDMREHPEWEVFPESIVAVLASSSMDAAARGLIQRGFRPEDVDTLKNYISTHDPLVASKTAALPIALGFSRTVGKYDRLKKPVPDSVVITFFYQSARATNESNRAWVADLLNQFDAQRRRILLSTFLEFETTGIWGPDDVKAGIASALANARLPNFEELATADAKGVAP
jgi:hypothetical protein